MSADELVSLFDEAGRVVGSAPRWRVRRENLRHGATCVLVRNGSGEVFVHRRTDDKDVYPGHWDFLAGGVLQHGELPGEAAARELAEELGISGVPLTSLGEADYADEHTRFRGFRYEVRWDGPVTLQPEEVAEGDWWPLGLLLARLDDPAWRFMPDSMALFGERLAELAR